VTQETDFPADEKIFIRLAMKRPARFSLNLRIPGWIASAPRILVNGRPFKTTASPASFAAIERVWKNGDKVELTLPQSLHTLPIDDMHPGTVALMKGPVMYAAVDATGEERRQTVTPPPGLTAFPQKQQENAPARRDQVYAPFYLVRDESYDTYFQSA
jgi:DUF1680 family protein